VRLASQQGHPFLLLCWVFILSIGQPATAQQSYQALRARPNQPNASRVAQPKQIPARFGGWKQANGKFNPSRPRARSLGRQALAYSERFQDLSIQTGLAPSAAMPGFFMRDSLPAGFIPTGVVTGDFNSDGKMDFVVSNGGDNNLWIYLGNGDGSFNLPTIVPITQGESPVAVTAGHLRGPNVLDIVVAESDSHSIGIFLGNGGGGFSESTVSLPYVPGAIVLGDFNNDGKTDLVVGYNDQNGKNTLAMLPGLGNGSLGTPISTPIGQYVPYVFWLSAADMNGDGKLDVMVSTSFAYISIQAYLGSGDGKFSPGQVVAESFIQQELTTALFDGDEDGKLDVVITDSFGILSFYHGNGDGTFATVPSSFGTGDIPYGMGVADLNGDGHLDVITSGVFVDGGPYGASAGNLTSVLLGDGTGSFSRARVYRGDLSAFSLAVADFNGDGHADIVTANQDSDSAVVFLNDGAGGFGDPQGNWIGFESGGAVNVPQSGLVSSDVNGDGFPDLALIEWYPNDSHFFQLAVMLNDGQGHFSDPIQSDAIDSTLSTNFGDFVLADFRNSGHKDFLAVGLDAYYGSSAYIAFASGSGSGQFSSLKTVTTPGAQGVVGVGDFDGNGKLDFVAVSGVLSNTNFLMCSVFAGNGDGTFRKVFTQPFGGSAFGTATAVYVEDFNRDGRLDLIVFSHDTGNIYELIGNGNGTFQAARALSTSQFWPMSAVDVNHDGHADLALYRSTLSPDDSGPWQFSLSLNQPNGSFLTGSPYSAYVGEYATPQAPYPTMAMEHYAPIVADFNGDGNPDVAIFQRSSSLLFPRVFVQFLLGDGDGTFIPSFTSFDFQKNSFPNLAADVNGDGLADLIELDGYRSSFHVIPAVPGPALTIQLVIDPVTTATGEALVTLAVPSVSSTLINLSTSDPEIHVPASVTVPAGKSSQGFSFTIGSGFNRNHVFALTAQLGTQAAVAYGTQVGAANVGFSTRLYNGPYTLPDLTLAAGQSSQLQVIADSHNGYSTDLTWTCTGLSSGAACTFSPPMVHLAAGDSSIVDLKVSVGPTVPQGIYPVNVHAVDGVLAYDTPFSLDVGDFSLRFAPGTIHLFPDQPLTAQAVLSSIFKYTRPVTLSCSAPPSVQCSVPPFSIPISVGEPFSVGVQTQSTPIGTYQITVTGIDDPLRHTAVATLEVWDFSPSVTPKSATIKAGASSDFTVSVQPVNGFAGDIALSCSAPAGISCDFTPTTVTVSGSGTSVSTLTVGTSASLALRHGRKHFSFAFLIYALTLPALIFSINGFQTRKTKLYGLLFLVICLVSCGGSGGAGGTTGGGSSGGSAGGPQGAVVTVHASSATTGVSYTKEVGQIQITLN
jgi:hypothetical protein